MKEYKAIFFSQYFMQEVFVEPMMGKQNPMYFNGANLDDFGEDNYLLLRSIDQLTYDEVMKIGKIMHSYGVLPENQTLEKMNEEAKRYLGKLDKNYSISAAAVRLVNQYLLRIGILLPFTYIHESGNVLTISPEDIINLGWAKLTTNQ